MDIYEIIQYYTPTNEQEVSDQQFILQAIQSFDDVLTRDNKIVHMSASPWIINQHFDKVLMVYHNIYQSWSWSGGHCDGDADFLAVALREAREETGLIVHPYSEAIFALDVLPVPAHYKNGKFVSAHIHINITYLCIGNDTHALQHKVDENQDVAWFAMDDVIEHVREEDMKPVYQKLINRVKKIKS